jgi:hypothetical protein
MENQNVVDQPLPTLFEYDKGELINKEIIEHIEITINLESIEHLLAEIEMYYPHVTNKLMLLIGHKEFDKEIGKLIITDRNDRAGFPKPVIDYLLKLSLLHEEKYKHTYTEPTEEKITWNRR